MKSQDIEEKITELKSIIDQYRHELGGLEKELYRAISDYQKALEEEKMKEIRQDLK